MKLTDAIVDWPIVSGIAVWRRNLTYAIFIPPELRTVRRLIARRRWVDVVQLLEEDSTRGSPSASALLGYLHIRGAVGSELNSSEASRLVLPHALRGDAFAAYVNGLIEYQRGDVRNAVAWLNRSRRRGFRPACHSIAQIAMLVPLKDPTAVGRVLRFGLRRGHIPAAVSYFALRRGLARGHPSLVVWTAGWMLAAFTLIVVNFLSPFCEPGVVHVIGSKRPVFDGAPVSSDCRPKTL